MGWQENLFSNLLTFSILAAIAIAAYCRITRKTLTELIVEVRDAFASPIEE